MKKHLLFLYILISLALYRIPLWGQAWVSDSISIPFPGNENIRLNCGLKADDKRETIPGLLSINEKVKWLFFPVDQIFISELPLEQGIMRFQIPQPEDYYLLDIHDFYISPGSGLFKKIYKWEAAFELSKLNGTDTSLSGSFYYEESFDLNPKTEDSSAYAEVLELSMKLLSHDINAITSLDGPVPLTGIHHFRAGRRVKNKNLYLLADSYFGISINGNSFTGIDAEVYFSPPEPTGTFRRSSRMFRYMNYGNRESAAISGKVPVFNYRLSESWLFRNKSALFIGFNKWHDIDESNRRLEELLLFQVTASQLIYRNILDQEGLIFGFGIMEEFSYIIYNDPSAGIGGSISIGYKF